LKPINHTISIIKFVTAIIILYNTIYPIMQCKKLYHPTYEVHYVDKA